jgi:hypothetical protein
MDTYLTFHRLFSKTNKILVTSRFLASKLGNVRLYENFYILKIEIVIGSFRTKNSLIWLQFLIYSKKLITICLLFTNLFHNFQEKKCKQKSAVQENCYHADAMLPSTKNKNLTLCKYTVPRRP